MCAHKHNYNTTQSLSTGTSGQQLTLRYKSFTRTCTLNIQYITPPQLLSLARWWLASNRAEAPYVCIYIEWAYPLCKRQFCKLPVYIAEFLPSLADLWFFFSVFSHIHTTILSFIYSHHGKHWSVTLMMKNKRECTVCRRSTHQSPPNTSIHLFPKQH